jgi:N-acetyl-gamma-glutamyl-phosphate reductase
MKKVAIVGARGYTGLELSKLLLEHPNVSLTAVFSSQLEWKLSQDIIHPKAQEAETLDLGTIENVANLFDAIFFATSAKQSAEVIPKIMYKHKSLT